MRQKEKKTQHRERKRNREGEKTQQRKKVPLREKKCKNGLVTLTRTAFNSTRHDSITHLI